jgi:hypothetical protein
VSVAASVVAGGAELDELHATVKARLVEKVNNFQRF